MNLRLWTAATIFMGSYFPLSLILLAQDFKYSYLQRGVCFNFLEEGSSCVLPFHNPQISLFIFFVCSVCFLITLTVMSIVKMNGSVKIVSAKYVPSELMNYTLPYVVSFMGVGYGDGDKFVGIIIFLVWIFWITHKSGQVILNPVLVAFGWRLHEITYQYPANGKEYTSTALLKGEVNVGKFVDNNWIQEVMIIKK